MTCRKESISGSNLILYHPIRYGRANKSVQQTGENAGAGLNRCVSDNPNKLSIEANDEKQFAKQS